MQLLDTAREQQGFHIYATPEIFLWAAENAMANDYANIWPLLGKLQSDRRRRNGARSPVVSKGSWDFSYAQTLLWFVQNINPVHAALRRSLHSGRNGYSVLGKTTLEELSRISKKMEVNKAFFMSTSYPHKCNAKDFASCSKEMYFISTVVGFPFCTCWRKPPFISKRSELYSGDNAEELLLPGLMSGNHYPLTILSITPWFNTNVSS